MYNPILDLKVGDSIYSEGIESEVIIEKILYQSENHAVVKVQDFTEFGTKYRLEFCYSSLAFGPHFLIEPVEYKLPSGYSMDQYWSITNRIYSIACL